jgi:hypothetical protein
MFGWDHCRRAGYSGRVTDRKQRGKLFRGQHLRLRGHAET